MLKLIYSLIGLLLISVIIVIIYGATFLEKAIEDIGSKAVGASVTVESVNLSFFSGMSSIKGLTIANPAGFKSPIALSLGDVYVSLDPLSLLSDKIHIKEVRISAPAVFYEGQLQKNNFKAIQNNIKSFIGTEKQQEPEQKKINSNNKQTIYKEEKSKKIQLDLFVFEEAEMSLVMNTPLGLQKATLRLPKIVIKDIGKEGNGASPAEIIQKITAPLLEQVGSGAIGAFANLDDLKANAQKKIKNKLNKVKEKAFGKLRSLFGQ